MKDEGKRGVGPHSSLLAMIKLDAPFYTEEELDALYESSPVEAMRISREQHMLRKRLADGVPAGVGAPLPSRGEIESVLEEARRILLRDGGDLEFSELAGDVLRVRLKGACVGCPRATLDLKNVVEALVRRRYPRIARVENIF